MKKRVLAGLLTILMVCSLTACGNTDGELTLEKENIGDVTDSSNGGDTTGPEKEGQRDPIVEETDILDVLTYLEMDDIFIVNQYGQVYKQYSMEETKKLIDGSMGSAYYLITVEDGIGYVLEYSGEGQDYSICLLAVDFEKKKVATVREFINQEVIYGVDVYDGAVYIRLCIDKIISEEKYIINGDLSFTQEAIEYEELFGALKDGVIYVNADNSHNYYHKDSVARTLDEIGFVLVVNNGKLLKLFADGRVEYPKGIDATSFYLLGYDANYAVLCVYNNSTYNNDIYIYGIGDGSYVRVMDSESGAREIAYNDGLLYYYVDESTEFDVINNKIYTYNAAENTSEMIYEADSHPGEYINPGVYGFTICGDNIYFITSTDTGVVWSKLQYSEAIYYYDYVCDIKKNDFLNYGTVSVEKYNKICDECEERAYGVYLECFQVKSEIDGRDIKKAAKNINKYLSDYSESVMSNNKELSEDSYHDDCNEHGQYSTTLESRISEVKIINDKYLSVFYKSYEYSGGAHGYPGRVQFLFDLENGNRIEITDIYTGSTEDLINTIVDATIKDLESYDEESSPYYYEESAQGIREDVGTRELERFIFEFDSDHVDVLYPPYDLGPYSSGYITVEIKYSDLIGRKLL